MDQHTLAPLNFAPCGQGVVGGEEGFGNGGGFGKGEVFRNRQDFILMHHDVLGMGAAARQTHNPVADAPAEGARSRRLDLPGVFHPGNIRRPPRRGGIGTAPLMDVGPVEPGSVNPDPNLTGHRSGVRYFHQRQDLGTARPGIHDRSHTEGFTSGRLQSTIKEDGPWIPASPR